MDSDALREPTIPPSSTSPPTASARGSRTTRRLLLGLSLGMVVLAAYVVIASVIEGILDRRWEPCRTIDLSEPTVEEKKAPDHPASPPASSLTLAVTPVISPERAVPLYDALVRFLAGKLGRTPVLLPTANYEEAYHLVRRSHCDLAIVCTYTFAFGEQAFGMQLLAAPVVQGRSTYQSLLVVPADSNAHSIGDLKGKRLATADKLSWTGWISTAVGLLERGENPDDYFEEIVIAGSHDRALRAVSAGLADGAAVDSLVYEATVRSEPGLARRLQVVERSPHFSMPPVVAHPHLDPALREQVRAALLTAHEDPVGREALSGLGIDRFFVPDPGEYEVVRRGMRLWEARR